MITINMTEFYRQCSQYRLMLQGAPSLTAVGQWVHCRHPDECSPDLKSASVHLFKTRTLAQYSSHFLFAARDFDPIAEKLAQFGSAHF